MSSPDERAGGGAGRGDDVAPPAESESVDVTSAGDGGVVPDEDVRVASDDEQPAGSKAVEPPD